MAFRRFSLTNKLRSITLVEVTIFLYQFISIRTRESWWLVQYGFSEHCLWGVTVCDILPRMLYGGSKQKHIINLML